MKKLYLLLCFQLFCFLAVAQNGTSSLDKVNKGRLNKTRTGMLILGTWAAGNIISSPFLASGREGSGKYFHQMNGLWNIVNLGIAGFGYFGIAGQDGQGLSLSESVLEQQKIENLLLFNTGLDVAYVLGGLYLYERSRNTGRNPERLKGYGQSIMLQGGFLFVFDLIFYLSMTHHGRQIDGIMQKIQFTGNSVGLIFRI